MKTLESFCCEALLGNNPRCWFEIQLKGFAEKIFVDADISVADGAIKITTGPCPFSGNGARVTLVHDDAPVWFTDLTCPIVYGNSITLTVPVEIH